MINNNQRSWYPVSISNYENLLSKVIQHGNGYKYSYALRKNIAYNLQYLEFVIRCVEDLKINSVIRTELFKTFIVAGCGIVEGLTKYILIKKDLHRTTDVKFVDKILGQLKTINNSRVRMDIHIYKKIPDKILAEMSFNSMIQLSEKKVIYGNNHILYGHLKILRKLRNKIHIQECVDWADHDWNAFNMKELKLMAKVVFEIFTSQIFRPTKVEVTYFDYLDNYRK